MKTTTRTIPYVLLFVLVFIATVHAQQPDRVGDASSWSIKSTKSTFDASGSFWTWDLDDSDGVNGPELYINDPNAAHWHFWIKHVATFEPFKDSWRANAEIQIRGEHRIPPHGGEGVNTLPPAISAHATHLLKDGKARKLVASRRVAHGPKKGHYDHYAVRQKATAVEMIGDFGPRKELNGPADIMARHTGTANQDKEAKKCIRKFITFKSKAKASPGSSVSYISSGPGAGYLTFDIGEIDVLDTIGGMSEGIDPAYASDPMLSGQLSIGDLQFQGTGDDGEYIFGPGTVSIIDPNGNFTFDASFGEYTIWGDTTSSDDVLTSFALLDELYINDIAEIEDGASAFLEDFVNIDIFGEGVEELEWDKIIGIDFSFITQTNLAVATNGFTQTVMDMPADLLVGSNGFPEPATLLLLSFGAVMLRKRR